MGAEIPGIKELIQNTINIETDVLETKKIIHNGKITSKVSSIPNSFLDNNIISKEIIYI